MKHRSSEVSCPKGHLYSGDNLIIRVKTKKGKTYTTRECRECTRERNRIKRASDRGGWCVLSG